jgi:hypothetical protein
MQKLSKLYPQIAYTTKSVYDALFQGAICFRPYERIRKLWAPPKCRFFMWLVAHNRSWQLTDWPGEAFPTQTDVCCVTRMRTFSTFSFSVCLLDSSGTPSCNMLVFLRLPHSLLNHPSMTGGRRWNLLLVVMHEKA